MSDPGSFTSIMELVESHLSKASLQANQDSATKASPSFSLPNICNVQGSSSVSLLPPPNLVMPLPRFEVKDNEINQVLALQVKNMLIAKEKRLNEEKEKQRLLEEKKNMKPKVEDNDDYVIDLTASIIRPGSFQPQTKAEVMSASSSLESLFSDVNNDIEMSKLEEPKEEPLPLCQDLSYLFYKKIKKGKCSAFGKVLCAKYKPVAAPYLGTPFVNPDIIPFDFSTPSPCDINKQKRLHPPIDPYAHMNMVERFMAMTKDEA